MILLLTVPCHVLGQQVSVNNLPRSGDTYLKQEVSYIGAEEGGQELFWDFSSVHVRRDGHEVSYWGDSLLVRTEGSGMYRYRLGGDSLLLIGYETPLVSVSYNRPVLQMILPATYGQQVMDTFSGEGTYCDRHRLKTSGQMLAETDATGTLLLTDEDTLRNVVRLHTIRTSSVWMDADSLTEATADGSKQEIEERYSWYAPGYRYPVFETLLRTTYDNLRPVSTCREACRYLPEDQRMLPDSVNERIAREQAEAWAAEQAAKAAKQAEDSSSALADHRVTVSGQTVSLTYSLSVDAHVTVLVADIMGMLYERREETHVAGEGYSLDIDCSRLRRGQYILYINVNGEVTSEKFNI